MEFLVQLCIRLRESQPQLVATRMTLRQAIARPRPNPLDTPPVAMAVGLHHDLESRPGPQRRHASERQSANAKPELQEARAEDAVTAANGLEEPTRCLSDFRVVTELGGHKTCWHDETLQLRQLCIAHLSPARQQAQDSLLMHTVEQPCRNNFKEAVDKSLEIHLAPLAQQEGAKQPNIGRLILRSHLAVTTASLELNACTCEVEPAQVFITHFMPNPPEIVGHCVVQAGQISKHHVLSFWCVIPIWRCTPRMEKVARQGCSLQEAECPWA
mmetsp:Transcript_61275/g.154662  ORF Transcript_61275/g.154662 Transcript_61275/m.154662 type:complete len:271 (-) Transcript_61275:957-1769(-)